MKNIFAKIFGTSMILTSAAFASGDSMKLINTKTGFTVVEFSAGKPHFHDRFLEEEMKETGILIPRALQDQYDGQEVILIDHPLFEKAFLEIYYPLCIANTLYQWQSNE